MKLEFNFTGTRQAVLTLFVFLATQTAAAVSNLDRYQQVLRRHVDKVDQPVSFKSPALRELSAVLREAIIEKQLGNIEAKFKSGELKNLGALNLADFFKRTEGVYFLEMTEHFQLDPSRATDFYVVNQKAAYINREWFDASPAGKIGIVMHIFLGAAGYQDEDYGLTLALIIANQCLGEVSGDYAEFCEGLDYQFLFPKTEAELFRKTSGKKGLTLFTQYGAHLAEKKPEQLAKGDGGFTGVGGGGNYRAYELKFEMIQAMPPVVKSFYSVLDCSDVWPAKADYLRDLFRTPIETSNQVSKLEFVAEPQSMRFTFPESLLADSEKRSSMIQTAIMGICLERKDSQKRKGK